MAEPRVSVRVGGREGPAVARVLESGTDEDASARRLLVAKYAGPGDDLTGWGRDALAVALDLDVHLDADPDPATPAGP